MNLIPKITYKHDQLFFTKEGLPLFVPKSQLHKVSQKGKLEGSTKTIDLLLASKLAGITLTNLTIESLIITLNGLKG